MNRIWMMLAILATSAALAQSISSGQEIISPDGKFSGQSGVIVLDDAPVLSLYGSGTITVYERSYLVGAPLQSIELGEPTRQTFDFNAFTLTSKNPIDNSIGYATSKTIDSTGGTLKTHEVQEVVFPNFVDPNARPNYQVSDTLQLQSDAWNFSGEGTVFLQYIDVDIQTASETMSFRGQENDIDAGAISTQETRRAFLIEGDIQWKFAGDATVYGNVDSLTGGSINVKGANGQVHYASNYFLSEFKEENNQITFQVSQQTAAPLFWPYLFLLLVIPLFFLPTQRKVQKAYEKGRYDYVRRFGPGLAKRNQRTATVTIHAWNRQDPQKARHIMRSLPPSAAPDKEHQDILTAEGRLQEGKWKEATRLMVRVLKQNPDAETPRGFSKIADQMEIQKAIRVRH